MYQVDTTLDRIGEALYREGINNPVDDFKYGKLGVALFLSEYGRHTGQEKYVSKAQEYIDLALSSLNATTFLPRPLEVFADIGNVLTYFISNGLVDDDTEFFCDLEKHISALTEDAFDRRDYDITGGVLSAAYYYLRRFDYTSTDVGRLERIINWIDHNKLVSQSGGLYWELLIQSEWRNYFGLSHGVAGILAFLGKCRRRGISPRQCASLINGGFKFILEHVNHHDPNRSTLPISLQHGYADKPMLEWCYGDLSTAAGLNEALGGGMDDPEAKRIKSLCKNIIVRSVSLISKNDVVQDASIVHGSAGMYVVLDSLRREHGNLISQVHLQLSYDQLCAGYEEEYARWGGFRSKYEYSSPACHLGFMSGSSGVGLCMLGHLYGAKDWYSFICL